MTRREVRGIACPARFPTDSGELARQPIECVGRGWGTGKSSGCDNWWSSAPSHGRDRGPTSASSLVSATLDPPYAGVPH
eukprot:6033047-Alexandrium_andersonii.AAC.1